MKVIVQLTISQTIEYQVIAVNTSVKWALQMLLKTIEANIPQKYRVVNDDGKDIVPAALGFEADEFPKWIVPVSTEEPPAAKPEKLNLDAFGPEGKKVLMAIGDEFKKIFLAMSAKDEQIKYLNQVVKELEVKVDVQRRLSQAFRNGMPTPPFAFHPDRVPPGYPAYNVDPVRAFGQPNFGNEYKDVFDGSAFENAPPYNWDLPGRPRRR